MRSALYYPHTELQHDHSQKLLKRALLLWDELEFIVPTPSYRPAYDDPVVAEAVELIGRNHYPDENEKRRAHEDIVELVTRPHLPAAFSYSYYEVNYSQEPYEIYPQKFLEETWEMLIEHGLAGDLLPDLDYPMAPATGLCVMGILADACAGSTRVRVTDRPEAYASIAGLLGSDHESDTDDQGDHRREQILAVTLKLLNLEEVTLSSLVDLRKREMKESGHTIRDLRHRYLERIESHLARILAPSVTPSDMDTLDRQFESDMRDDLAQLKSELKLEFKQALWSKDVIVSLLAGAGAIAAVAFAAPVAMAVGVTSAGFSAPVAVGGVLASRARFLKSRAELLRKHPMAYLYEVRSGVKY